MNAIQSIPAILRGERMPASGSVALPTLCALVLGPVLLFMSSGYLGPVAEIAALVAVTPCGILAGRIANAWDRDRRLRAYWR